MKETEFLGPLFIVGMPRSGTKLLRSLLNEHPRIRIAEIETEFLPYWVRHWNSYGDLSDADTFHRFYLNATQLPYFTYMLERGRLIDEQVWFRACESFDAAGVFEALVRHDATVRDEAGQLWGDKSPTYVRNMTLLKTVFPRARFLHIIRDARDYCVSIRSVWGKNIARGAQRWAADVSLARQQGARLGADYHEVLYEKLLTDTRHEMERICEFVDVDFDARILSPTVEVENLGGTKGVKGIVATNCGKYITKLTPREKARVEKLTRPVLHALGYPVDEAGPAGKLGSIQLLAYQLLDGVNLVRSELQNRGVLGALSFHWRYFLSSGNRFN